MKKPMTVRLEQSTLDRLSVMASEQGMTRQDLVERLLIDATKGINMPNNDQTLSHVPQSVLQAIRDKSSRLSQGTEISLKRLAGETNWQSLSDSTRRVFGKQFLEMVSAGEFPSLTVGRKKSNNEQQYVVR